MVWGEELTNGIRPARGQLLLNRMSRANVTTGMVTVVTPTRNREQLLGRMLAYYRSVEPRFPIVIMDSSDRPIQSLRTQELLSTPGVTYVVSDPGVPAFMKFVEGIKRVMTPYAVAWADDDFLVPRTLLAGVEFLEAHPSYATVQGVALSFGVKTRHGQLEVEDVSNYPQRSEDADHAGARIRSCFQSYWPAFYSLHRTPDLVANVETVRRSRVTASSWMELALAALSLARGKSKKLPSLYMVRQFHAANTGNRNPDGTAQTAFDWMLSPDFSSDANKVIEMLVPVVASTDGVPEAEAEITIRQALLAYLGVQIEKAHSGMIAAQSPVRAAAKGVPGVRSAVRISRSALRRIKERASGTPTLAELRSGRSVYSGDFKPIYEAIVGRAPSSSGQG